MNPNEMSGDDLCEQPVLQWPELRALTGLGALALLLFVGTGAVTPLSVTPAQEAAAIQATPPSASSVENIYDAQPFLWPTVSSSTPTEELPTATVHSLD